MKQLIVDYLPFEIQKKDVDKNYMLRRLGQWIEHLESLKHEIMMEKDK